MILDQFDADALSACNNLSPEQFMYEFYGKRIGKNNAGKYATGIKKHLEKKQELPNPSQSNGLNEKAIAGNGQVTTKRMVMLSETDSNNKYRIMQLMGYDPLQWELVSCKVRRNDWDVTMKHKEYNREASGEAYAYSYAEKHTNHQYRIDLTVKPLQDIVTSEWVRDLFSDANPPELLEYSYDPGSLLLELPMMDVHLGKLAWGEETGQDYDLKIAIELYKATIRDLVEKLTFLNLPIELILFPVGQDFFHVDNSTSMTTAGTQVDTDTRWQKMYRDGIEALIWSVEELRKLAKVEVMWVGGNHDKVLSYTAVHYINAWYRNTNSVNVNTKPTNRKYYKYGKVLIGWSHGKEGKRIEHLMQQEQPKAWGDSRYREWHLGDLHHEEAKEVGGIKIRRLSSITALDAWHSEKGYMAQRMAQAFIWHKDKGRQYVIDSNVEIFQPA